MFVSFSHVTQSTVPGPGTVAVLPLGAMEAHGPHLPLGTDSIIAEGILDHAAALDQSSELILRLPTMWLGASSEHTCNAGTLSAEPEQVIEQIICVGEGLARAGIMRVMLFNAHGGNVAASLIAALKLRTRFAMLVVSVHWLDFGLPTAIEPPAPVADDVHGGWIETSVILHLAPQLVATQLLAARPPVPLSVSLFPRGPVNWGWRIDDLAPIDGKAGWIGSPNLASAELGQMLVDHASKRVLKTLHEIAAYRVEFRR